MNPNRAVAAIDIGSNTIKLLVAAPSQDGAGLAVLHEQTVESRIGTGIGGGRPSLAPAAILAGVDAVKRLVETARPFSPGAIVIAATSAVRDAANGAEFAALIQASTGIPLRILTGAEEAELIGCGLRTDPALRGLARFPLLDLGGGSLEVLAFEGGNPVHAASLPLGCVRLTEKFVPDPAAPLPAGAREAVRAEVRRQIESLKWAGAPPRMEEAVGMGGTFNTALALLPARKSRNPSLTIGELEFLLERCARADLATRRAMTGMPASRADVMPAALATVLEVSCIMQVKVFHISFHNLRYGLAAEWLAGTSACI